MRAESPGPESRTVREWRPRDSRGAPTSSVDSRGGSALRAGLHRSRRGAAPYTTPGVQQEDLGARPSILDLEPGQAGRLPGRRGVVDDISHEDLRILLREEGVTFQRVKTWKTSNDPNYAAKKARVEHLYAIADGEVIPEDGEPEVIFCMDEFGPLNLQPHPGRQWAERGGKGQGPRAGTPPPAAGDLHPSAWCPAPLRRLRPGQGPALRPHQVDQEPLHVPGVLPLPALIAPCDGADRHRL